jgi:hypothetical protein
MAQGRPWHDPSSIGPPEEEPDNRRYIVFQNSQQGCLTGSEPHRQVNVELLTPGPQKTIPVSDKTDDTMFDKEVSQGARPNAGIKSCTLK